MKTLHSLGRRMLDPETEYAVIMKAARMNEQGTGAIITARIRGEDFDRTFEGVHWIPADIEYIRRAMNNERNVTEYFYGRREIHP
jgi:hypothetical protein